MVITLSNGREFCPGRWHENVSIHTVPHHKLGVAECRSCGTIKEIEYRKAAGRPVGYCSIGDIAKRLKCSACGERNAILHLGDYQAEPGQFDLG